MKKQNKKIISLLLVCVMLFSCLVTVISAQETITLTFVADGATVDTKQGTAGASVTLPDAPTMQDRVFVGWHATIGGKTVFLPAGTSYNLQETATFTAVGIAFDTNAGASVRVKTDDVGLRFTSSVDKADYAALKKIVGDSIIYGTYIIAASYLPRMGRVFTIEALKNAGYTQYIDIPADGFYREDDSTYTLAGSVNNILKGNYTREYAGRGYIKVTYTDGSVGTVYATFNQTDNVRNIYEIVLDAYEDRDVSYPNYVDGKLNSPYTVDQLRSLEEFLNCIIDVRFNGSYTNFYVKGATYYTPKYEFVAFHDYNYNSGAGMNAENKDNKERVYIASAQSGYDVEDIKGILIGGSHCDFDGRKVRIETYNGKKVISFFFTTFSAPY